MQAICFNRTFLNNKMVLPMRLELTSQRPRRLRPLRLPISSQERISRLAHFKEKRKSVYFDISDIMSGMEEVRLKSFKELTNEELYAIYHLRVAVFVVEQHCPYQEVDDKDLEALHLFIMDSNEIMAYLRIILASLEDSRLRLGRIVTKKRKRGYGRKIVNLALDYCRNILKVDEVYIEAQVQALGFYEKLGFETVGEIFLEDGIPHIKMKRRLLF